MSDHLEISVILADGTTESREIFMSYGLLNQLCGIVGSIDRVAILDTDQELADTILQMVLIPRFASGKPTIKLDDYDPPGLDQQNAELVFDWVKEQVLGFFSRRVQATIKLMDANKEALTAIGSSLVGLKGEASSKLLS